MASLTEGDLPLHRYYFYDGLQWNGCLVDLGESAWIQMSKRWFCVSMGN